jgi:hypothetical protein
MGCAVIVGAAGLAASALILLISIGLLIHDHPPQDEWGGLGYYLLGAIFIIFIAVPFWVLPARAAYRRLRGA